MVLAILNFWAQFALAEIAFEDDKGTIERTVKGHQGGIEKIGVEKFGNLFILL